MIKKKRNPKRKHQQKKKTKNVINQQRFSSQQNAFQQALKLHQSGQLQQARTLYEKILTEEPDHPEVLHYLGLLVYQQGQNDVAVRLINKALSLYPNYVEAYLNLGIIMHALGRQEEALSNFKKVLTLNPNYVEAYNKQGNVFMAQGQLAEAAASYQRALTLKPDYASVHLNLGNVFKAQGRLSEAVASYSRAISLKPDYVGAYLNLGNALNDQGKLDEAINNYRQALALKPDFFEALNNLGNALNEKGKYDEAITCYRQALSLNPNYDEAYLNLGILYKELGKMDDAITCYKKTLSLKPDNVQAFGGLCAIVKYTEIDDVLITMEALFAQKGEKTDTDHIYLGFSLGKVFEDLKQYDKSFQYISEANRLKRGSYNYSIAADRHLFGNIKNFFSPDFFASHQRTGCKDETPIFIIGMLRSGSTLVEQILASHPKIYGAGEINNLENLIKEYCLDGTKTEFPECVQHLNEDIFERMGWEYIKEVRGYSKEAGHITDKMLHNFLYIGLIKTILPNAKVIHCMRDPMDNCFSIFKNNFTEPHKYAYDLVELGQYFNLYHDLMTHWQKNLPGFIYTVYYEKIVADQRSQTEKLLEFCGLPWDEACLSFHKTERSIKTASVVQVRQPIYNNSVKLWQRYEKQLGPLRKVLYD